MFGRLQLIERNDGHLTSESYETNAGGILQDLRISFPCDSMEYELLKSMTRSRTQKDGDLHQTLMIAFGKERTVPVSKQSNNTIGKYIHIPFTTSN